MELRKVFCILKEFPLTAVKLTGEKKDYFNLHSKLAASSVLPEPLYIATFG